MRAAVYYGNRDLRIEERTQPKAGPGELVFRVMASGVCGSDVVEWYRLAKAPIVLGHEVAGEVVEIGPGLAGFARGDRIVTTHHVPCNDCRYCRAGHHPVCETLRTTSFDPGGFAELVRVPAANVARGTFAIPDHVAYDDASFVEPLACVVRGQRIAGGVAGRTVAVLGSGMTGLLHILWAKANGASRVIATDIHAFRLEAARRAGADATIDARHEEIQERVDLAIVCAPAMAAVGHAIRTVDRGGTILLFALFPPGATFPVPLFELFKDGITVTSSYAGPPADMRTALDAIAARKIEVASLITHRLPLEKIGDAFKTGRGCGRVFEGDREAAGVGDSRLFVTKPKHPAQRRESPYDRDRVRGVHMLHPRAAYPISGAFALVCVVLATPSASARELTFDERVVAQKAIEQVYWNHRIWPKENPGAKPALSTHLSDQTIRARVEDYLKKSNALELKWQRPITAVQLQAELDRMAKDTKDGTTLRELFAALGNDPLVIAETLGRQTLVDRLIRSWYATDQRFHGALKTTAENALAACNDAACLKTRSGEYRETIWKLRTDDAEPAVDGDPAAVSLRADEWSGKLESLPKAYAPIALEETPDAFVATAVRTRSEREVITASVTWTKRPFDRWWADERVRVEAPIELPSGSYSIPDVLLTTCTNDTWIRTRAEVPDGRYGHKAVWTGTEMIIWGASRSGGRYTPATDAWTLTSELNVPSGRVNNSAVWTGTEMIIWGGVPFESSNSSFNDGGRYNPATDSWTATSTGANVPTARNLHTAVWTGTEMIVWGGQTGFTNSTKLNSGGRFNPSSNSWSATTTAGAVPSARSFHTAVCDGFEDDRLGGGTNSGGLYDPASDAWSATSMGANVPTPRANHTAVWTGSKMIIWGGGGAPLPPAASTIRPATLGWRHRRVRTSRAGATRTRAVWTGSEMIVWGGRNGTFNNVYPPIGGRYNPTADTWSATSAGPGELATIGKALHSAVWTGSEMIVWGGMRGGSGYKDGGRYDPSTDSLGPDVRERDGPRPARLPHTGLDGHGDDHVGRTRGG